MNYLVQINAFKKRRRLYPISCGSICLYYVLLEYANSLGFPKEFTVANQIIAGICSMSMSKMIRSRDELVDKDYIKYTDGKKGISCGKYSIIEYTFEERRVIENSYDNTFDNTFDNTSDNTSGLKMTTLYKYKRKEKLNKRDLKIQETSWHDYDIDAIEKAALKKSLEN